MKPSPAHQFDDLDEDLFFEAAYHHRRKDSAELALLATTEVGLEYFTEVGAQP